MALVMKREKAGIRVAPPTSSTCAAPAAPHLTRAQCALQGSGRACCPSAPHGLPAGSGRGLLEDGAVDRELGVAVEAVTMAGH